MDEEGEAKEQMRYKEERLRAEYEAKFGTDPMALRFSREEQLQVTT